MPTLKRRYPGLKFSVQTIKEFVIRLDELYIEQMRRSYPGADSYPVRSDLSFHVELENGDEWELDSRSEFYSMYGASDLVSAAFSGNNYEPRFDLGFSTYGGTEARLKFSERSLLYEVFEILESGVESATSSYPATQGEVAGSKTIVFLGHGHSATWRELKESLELYEVDVITYETEKRHGYSVKETLERMLHKCNFAVLIHTAEDEQEDGALRARQNVVHETGLFQGRLGFARAIVVREEQCEPFSNVEGINEIRFRSIREAVGEVLLAIRRELEDL